MFRTDDPLADFARYDAEREAEYERLPKCVYCDQHIQDEYLYDINDELICKGCLDEHFKKPTENYCR